MKIEKIKGKIFNAQEVQAIIAGNKTMFREVIKPQLPVKCLYQVGQKIFVKESFFEELHPDSLKATNKIYYAATCNEEVIKVDGDGWQLFRKNGDPASPWKPAQHMKQEHSRITLEITDIKVERLGEISADDCWKEGIDYSPECCQNYIAVPDCNGNPTISCCNNPNVEHPRLAFENLWNANQKKPEEKFEANPFVWVVDFKINK